MDPQTLHLLCDPETHVPLELSGDSLMNSESGRRYPIRDGIPVFLQEVTGPNRKYQAMYDRLAPGYDIAERLYYWVTRKPNYRLEYIHEMEMAAGARVLEVSVGTGGNLGYLRPDIEFLGLDLSWHVASMPPQREALAAQCPTFPGRSRATAVPRRNLRLRFSRRRHQLLQFSDKARAIAEMVRVAKPGTKIVIVDETEKVVSEMYLKIPVTRSYFADRDEAVSCPIDLVPGEMGEIRARQFGDGKLYCLTFRKPAYQ